MEHEPELIERANVAISKAIMQLMRVKQLTFDVSVLLNLPRKFTDEVPLIAVNDVRLLINPTAFLEYSCEEHQFMLRHEAWHIIGFDLLRRLDKDHRTWNMACDYWINSMIKHDPICNLPMPSGGLYDDKFIDWEKEQIYEYLISDFESSKNVEFSTDLIESDNDADSQGNTYEQNVEKLEKEIGAILAQSALQAKYAGGDVPIEIQKYLDALYAPKINWDGLLLKYMEAYSSFDFSYKRINRKYLCHNIILPSMHSECLDEIYLAVDESSSVSDEDYALYLGAVQEIHRRLQPNNMKVIGFTTRITKVTDVSEINGIEDLKTRTIGGTYIPVVIDYIKENKLNPTVLIVLSDMESHLPAKPTYDVIWICVNNPKWRAPYGKVVHVTN